MKRFCTRWGETRFVCDVHLAKVAKYLRLLGFDTVWHHDMGDDELLGWTRCGRIGLTCDRELQGRAPGRVVLLRCEEAGRQVARLSAMFGLARHAHPFRRSLCCNRPVVAVAKADAKDGVPLQTYRWLRGYWACPKCGKLYWRGTHARRMRRNVLELLGLSGKSVGNVREVKYVEESKRW
ncbi:Mut7-C RNAse domain-containing protein [Hydrogenimonas sp.]